VSPSSAHTNGENNGSGTITHEKPKFVVLGLIPGAVVAVPVETPGGVDKNAPIGIVGGVGVHGVRVAQISKGLSGVDQQLIFQVLKARDIDLGVEDAQRPVDVGLEAQP
jgi:hypothetical protein